MSFYFGVKLLLFQEPKYFYLDFNANHNLFSVISILSLAFFLLVLQTVIALAFLCWILINVFFILSFKKITIFRTGFLVCFCFLSQPAFHTSNITEKALKKMKIIGLNPNFSVCCLLFFGFFYCCCCYDITLNLPYYGQANKIDHQ